MIYIIFIIYIFLELLYIIRYLILFIKLNNKKIKYDKISKNMKKAFLNDLYTNNYNYLNIENIFFNKLQIQNINKKDIIKTYYEISTNYYKNLKYLKVLSKIFDKIEKKHKLIFSKTSLMSKNRLKWKKMTLNSLYSPFLFDTLKLFLRIYRNNYLYNSGFTKHNLNKNYIIWTNKYDIKKGIPIIFFHCSVGGLVFYEKLLNQWGDKFNLILPEIPGISWQNDTSELPSMKEMTNMLFNFLTNNYGNIDKFIIVGHSLGSNICSYVINSNPNIICKVLLIEPGVFIPDLLINFSDFNNLSILDINISELIYFPIYYGSIFVQYYFQREFSLNNMLFSDILKKLKLDIHFIYSGDDKKLIPKYQINYIIENNIKCKYTIFKKYTHGSLINKHKMINYCTEILKKWI